MHFKGVVTAVPTATTGYEVGDVVLVAGSTVETDNGKEFVLANTGTVAEPDYKWELIGDQNAIGTLTEYVDDQVENLSNAVIAEYATKAEVSDISSTLSTDYVGKIATAKTEAYNEALSDANDYTDEKIAELGIDDYATIEYVNGVSSELSTTTHNEITAVVGQAGDLSTANTVYGAKKYAEGYTDAAIDALDIGNYATKTEVSDISSTLSTDYVGKIATAKTEALSDANAYTDGAIADLSIDNYIKHGEVIQSDLSGFFVLDCGDSVIRDNEPTA